MFGRWSKRASDDLEGHALRHVVDSHLPDADDETRRIVTSIAGLLGGVAYADREYAGAEESRVRSALRGIHGLTDQGVDAIVTALKDDIVVIATVQSPRYCRTLVELCDRELRREVLALLLDIAGADGVLSHDEVTLLRNTTRALGLDQADYNDLQSPHRHKLSSLK